MGDRLRFGRGGALGQGSRNRRGGRVQSGRARGQRQGALWQGGGDCKGGRVRLRRGRVQGHGLHGQGDGDGRQPGWGCISRGTGDMWRIGYSEGDVGLDQVVMFHLMGLWLLTGWYVDRCASSRRVGCM
jgi:hypothetical protein